MLAFVLAIAAICSCIVWYGFQWVSECSVKEMVPTEGRALAPRAHYLCTKAWDIENMPHNWERMQADTQWRTELQQYIADHSKSISAHNKNNVYSLPAKKQHASN